jgi:hypothetical protein
MQTLKSMHKGITLMYSENRAWTTLIMHLNYYIHLCKIISSALCIVRLASCAGCMQYGQSCYCAFQFVSSALAHHVPCLLSIQIT